MGRREEVAERRSLRFVFLLMMGAIVISCWVAGGQAVVPLMRLRGIPLPLLDANTTVNAINTHDSRNERSTVFCRTRGIHSKVRAGLYASSPSWGMGILSN